MYQFRDTGYKRFICTKLNAIGSNDCGVIYLASESYKDADGNLIWSRACDGGDATTLESLPAKDFLQNLGNWSTGNIDDLILGANKSGIVWINATVTGMPVEGKYWFGIIDCSNAHRCLRVTSQTDGQSFVRAYNSSSQYWYAWHNVADGGNADTLDGKHASEFMQFLGDIRNGSLLDYVLSLNKSGFLYCGGANCTDMPVDGAYFVVEVRCYGNVRVATATDFSTGIVYINRYSGTTWFGWHRVADGGNADTVDGKNASDFMQNLGALTTGSLLDYVLTLTSSGSFFVSNNVTDTPVSGLFYGVDVIRHTGGDYVITATRFNGGGVWTNRYNAGAKKWYGWSNVADGGNAASVGTYTEAKIAALETRIAALERGTT